jgi:hypothetical protein
MLAFSWPCLRSPEFIGPAEDVCRRSPKRPSCRGQVCADFSRRAGTIGSEHLAACVRAHRALVGLDRDEPVGKELRASAELQVASLGRGLSSSIAWDEVPNPVSEQGHLTFSPHWDEMPWFLRQPALGSSRDGHDKETRTSTIRRPDETAFRDSADLSRSRGLRPGRPHAPWRSGFGPDWAKRRCDG